MALALPLSRCQHLVDGDQARPASSEVRIQIMTSTEMLMRTHGVKLFVFYNVHHGSLR
ncbi:hypothetical protein SynPROSU1_02280 [Synechococcus sp. PROS-U-1]|nr:hypothetical protein SynPROSU1_02280 [Synechococcus sp. PROS-U-1]